MKTTTLYISIVIALIIGGGVGYFSGKGTNNTQVQSRELQDSITMMNTQSATIQKMAEIMKSSGVMMQEIGMKYENTDTVTKGKDLEMMGIKYTTENKNSSESSGTMRSMMTH
jgi:hypothetical protein